MPYRRVKGTHDLLPDESRQWLAVEKQISRILNQSGFELIRTPVFEVTELFARGVGEDTDVVSKEMYTFSDMSGASLTLRPELTAPVIRAYIQENLGQLAPVTKVYYIDSLFRQERPQKGRLRQFHQFGMEIVGSPYPEADAEIIQTVTAILQSFGITELDLKINSIGSRAGRQRYLETLRQALSPVKDRFCPTCQKRYTRNILRLFDCKVPDCQALLDRHAPLISENLDDADRNHFSEVQQLLKTAGVSFRIDPKLVRGLDYYTRTTFEISSPLLGSQDALCGGGRYDHLVEDLGGAPTPAVGVAAGMERLLLVLNQTGALVLPGEPLLYFALLGARAREAGFRLMTQCRQAGIRCDMDFFRRSLKAQLREAGRRQADQVVIIGEDEVNQGRLAFKDMKTGAQSEMSLGAAPDRLRQMLCPAHRE